MIEENKKNPRQLWSYLRDLCPAPFVIRDGELELTDPAQVANIVNSFFATIADRFITEEQVLEQQHAQLKEFIRDRLDEDFYIPEMTEQSVKKALASRQRKHIHWV